MKKYLLLLGLVSLVSSCSMLKTAKLLKSGGTKQKVYSATLNFDFDNLIKIPVKIKDKTYVFIFDTGAATSVISQKLAKDLGLKPKSSIAIQDSQHNESATQFYLIDSLSIGMVTFLKEPFISADFSKMDCVGEEFDGIIGANLMCNAVWFIDNEHKQITLVDQKNKLKALPHAEIIPFKTYQNGLFMNVNPYFKMYIPGFVNNKMVELDMGSAYGIKLNKKLVTRNVASTAEYSIGNAGLGLFGRNKKDTTFYFFTHSWMLGKMKVVEDREVIYKGANIPTLGMDFLKNYNIILDWSRREISLSQFHTTDNTKELPYGFGIGRDSTGVIVNELYNNSDAMKKGLNLGDKIIAIDDIVFENNSGTSECAAIKQFAHLDKKEIIVTVNQAGINRKLSIAQR